MGVKQSKKSTSKSRNKDYLCSKCSNTFHHAKDLNLHLSACPSNQNAIRTQGRYIPKPQTLTQRHQANSINPQRNIINIDQRSQIRVSQSNENSLKQSTLSNISSNISNSSFDLKVKEFRSNLNKIKIDWREGCDTLEVERQSIVLNSIKGFQEINPLKELKINFKGEVSHDAGGLIREWLTVLFQHFLDETNNLFIRTETDDISYIVKQAKDITGTLLESYYFIGKLIGKALLENLTVNCCFNKLIYKIVLEEEVQLDELVFIDKPLYHSLNEIVNMKSNIDDLYLFFSIEYESSNGTIQSANLIPNGNTIKVTKDNIHLYIKKRIEYLIETQKVFVNEIRRGIKSIIPIRYLQKFSSDEFALMLNGTPFIDPEDWRSHTVYKDYHTTDTIVKEYWALMNTLSQQNLSKFLQFCTGSSRVPIGGFSSLESNRGNKARFCITKGNYYPNQINYIRAHTCFNRLDLPNFPNKSQLESSIQFILKNESIGFGID